MLYVGPIIIQMELFTNTLVGIRTRDLRIESIANSDEANSLNSWELRSIQSSSVALYY